MRLFAYANAQTVVGFLHILRFVATVFGSIRFRQDQIKVTGASIMGKYFLGWILGVPVIVLVIVYFIFN